MGEAGGAVRSHPSSSLLAEHGSEEAGIGVGVGAGISQRAGRGETLWSRRRRQKEAEETAARKEAERAKKMRAEMVLEVLYIYIWYTLTS